VFRQAGRLSYKRFNAKVSSFQIGSLRTFFVGADDNLVPGADTVCQNFSCPLQFGFREAVNTGKAQPQCHLCIKLVDILPAGAAGSGEADFRGVAYGLTQENGIHIDSLVYYRRKMKTVHAPEFNPSNSRGLENKPAMPIA